MLIHPPPSYIPVLMAQARIYWERKNYPQVEKIFRKSVEFCSENETWKLNVAHVLFMQVSTRNLGRLPTLELLFDLIDLFDRTSSKSLVAFMSLW